MKPESSLLCSEEPITCPLHPVLTFPPSSSKIRSNIIFLSVPRSFEWPLPFRFYDRHFVCIFHLSHPCYVPRPCHPSPFHHPNNILWSIQIMKLLVMQFSPPFCHILPHRSEYSPQHPVLKHRQSTVFTRCERPGFKSIRNERQNYSFVYLALFNYGLLKDFAPVS